MIIPVVLAGGSGTRLWPLSREMYPKQLLKLTNDHSLLQNTALRARKIPGALPPVVICGEPHRFLVAEQLREAGIQAPVLFLTARDRVEDVRAHLKEGEAVEAVIINVDRKTRSIQLSIKAKDNADNQEAMQRLSATTERENAGTTSLGALLRAKLDNNS
mgnify:CR=1 FL=1